MAKAPSESTQIRTLKRELKEARDARMYAERDRDAYRARATKAEQDAAQWRARFDILLRRENDNG